MNHFLSNRSLQNRHIFLRIDGNVPIDNGIITNDFRLNAVLPTVSFLAEHGSHLTIATHLGRPKGVNPLLSTNIIAEWFEKKGIKNISFLENLRFDPGEKEGTITFAKKLASAIDFYVNDAWGVCHRKDCSVYALPHLFAPENRALGFLIDQEIKALSPLRYPAQKPYMIILGGAKLPDKILYMKYLIEKKIPNTLAILPGLAFTFLAAKNTPVGKSLIFPELIDECALIMRNAKEAGITLILPEDFIIEDGNGTFAYNQSTHIPDQCRGVTIGEKTVNTLSSYIGSAESIFFNGALEMGDSHMTNTPFFELFSKLASKGKSTVIGGGETIAAAEKCGLREKFLWCSSGGGSTLAFISGAQMPGLDIFGLSY